MPRSRGRLAAWLFAVFLFASTIPVARAHAQAPHVPCPVLSARSSVEYVTAGEFAGTYRYKIDLTWDLGRRDPTHLDILVGLLDCACVCDPRLFRFVTPAGTSNGVNLSGACLVSYTADYRCMGDPSIQGTTPGAAIRLHAIDDGCENDGAGTGSFVFYSPLPPGGDGMYGDAIALKQNGTTCYGVLMGYLPMCDCTVPAGPASWGRVKSVYR
jgi:hypothetical protein